MSKGVFAGPIVVAGQCPMGCGETLYVGDDDRITCSEEFCPEPEAVHKLLDNEHIESHIVDIAWYDDGQDRFNANMQHPLHERVIDPKTGEPVLFNCPLSAALDAEAIRNVPAQDGRYYATYALETNKWYWNKIEENN